MTKIAIYLIFFLSAFNLLNSKEVNFHAWGGSPIINDFIQNAAKDLKNQNIILRHTKIIDIADSIKILEQDKQSSNFNNGSIDLMWVNGENFHRLKKEKLLFGPIENLKNSKYFNKEDMTLKFDFGESVDQLEVPWGRAQFVFIYDSEMIQVAPQTINELLNFIKKNPGRFTYPKVPNFHGTTFLKQLLYELVKDKSVLQKPFNECIYPCKPLKQLMTYLKTIHPYLWKKGKRFPQSANETIPMLANREIWMTISFNPNDAGINVMNGNLRKSTRTTSFKKGAISNTHFLAIPFNSKNKKTSRKVIDYFISPGSQSDKANINIWGDPTVLDINSLSSQNQMLFEQSSNAYVLQNNTIPYLIEPHYSWTEAIENEWFKTFN